MIVRLLFTSSAFSWLLAAFEPLTGLIVHCVQHDAVLDYYGRRLATCSSDKTIKIFEVDGESHRLTETLKGYERPIPASALFTEFNAVMRVQYGVYPGFVNLSGCCIVIARTDSV